ncbi:MAG: 30S ribosome-binding factor RbfA [Lentisphaerae bacterium]|nr:30S ribosome-binding factor RbfA [Lentisphaerota bacterium]
MSCNRLTRVNELLKREIGDMLFRIMHEQSFDLAAVSITRVIASRNLRQARVMVSMRCPPRERDHMLRLLQAHRPEIQQRINRDMSLKYTPRLIFELDQSLEEGDRILNLINQMEEENPELFDNDQPDDYKAELNDQ